MKTKTAAIAGLVIVAYVIVLTTIRIPVDEYQGILCISGQNHVYVPAESALFLKTYDTFELERMSRVHLDESKKYATAYACERRDKYIPILHLFSRFKLYKTIWNGNTVYFQMDRDAGSKIWVEKEMRLPELTVETIQTIIILVGEKEGVEERITIETPMEIENFLANYLEMFEKLDLQFKWYEIHVHYSNSDENLYEWFRKSDFIHLMER